MQNKKEEFLKKAKKKFGDKFSYEKVDYINCKTKVIITCPKHGDFLITPDSFLSSTHGCKKCSLEKQSENQLLSTEDFIKRAIKVHGLKYDYSKSEYLGINKKINIICPEHGEFQQLPHNHWNGKGCPKCKAESNRARFSFTKEQFIKKANTKFKNKFNYDLVEYINCDTPVRIVCPEHGEFLQTPYAHLNSKFGCEKCAKHETGMSFRKDKEHFVEKARQVHGDRYDYSELDYIENKSKVKIICPKHGAFFQLPSNHYAGNGCPVCHNSRIEDFVRDYLTENNISFEEKNRKIISPYELDFVIEDKKLAIECNGVYWHSESEGKDKQYHINKTTKSKNKGYKLIQILESEIIDKPDIVKSRLNSILGLNKRRIYARKCKVKEISSQLKGKFLNKYHIQGNDKSKVNLGLFYKGKLCSVMTFSSRRRALGANEKEGYWELSRFCGNFWFNVIGGAGKLLSFFEKNYDPSQIITYADLRWSVGNLYYQLGFELSHQSSPNYWYFKKGEIKLFHRYNFAKHKLKNKLQKFDPNKTESQNMQQNKYDKIWDCGNLVFKKNKNKLTNSLHNLI